MFDTFRCIEIFVISTSPSVEEVLIPQQMLWLKGGV